MIGGQDRNPRSGCWSGHRRSEIGLFRFCGVALEVTVVFVCIFDGKILSISLCTVQFLCFVCPVVSFLRNFLPCCINVDKSFADTNYGNYLPQFVTQFRAIFTISRESLEFTTNRRVGC